MMPGGQHQRLLGGLQRAVAAINACPGSLCDAWCQAALHASLGDLLQWYPAPGAAPFAVKQQQRLAAALMALLTALAEERHPCDDAWQTAAFATVSVLNTCAETQPTLAEEFLGSAGRAALQSFLVRLGSCCQEGGPPLSAQGVGAIALAAQAVMEVYRRMFSTAATLAAAMSSMADFGRLLMAPVLQTFAPPPPPPPCHRTAGACCACPGHVSIPGVRAFVSAGVRSDLRVYGRTITNVHPFEVPRLVAGVCYSEAMCSAGMRGTLAGAGWLRLCSIAMALQAHAARQRGHPRAFAGAGAANLARFVDPALLPLAAAAASEAEEVSPAPCVMGGAALALDPRHTPECAACLPDQLMLLLEAAGLVDNPLQAALCYKHLCRTVAALCSHGAAAAGALRGFWPRAWRHLAARALQAVREAEQAPEGSDAALRHEATLQFLELVLAVCVMDGCQPDDGAALDAICEAAARTCPALLHGYACMFFRLRLRCILSPSSGASLQGPACDGSSLPRTLAAVMVSIGKLVQFHGAAGEVAGAADRLDRLADDVAARELASAVFVKCTLDMDGGSHAPTAAAFTGEPPGTDGDVDELLPPLAALLAERAERGEPWVQLSVLLAARVDGALARRVLLEGGQALLSADSRDHVTWWAAQLQRPPLWDAVQRATHGGVAPSDVISGGGVSPADDPSKRPTAAAASGEAREGGAERRHQTHEDSASAADDGGDGGASACTAALRFLADLHDRLDPHALGVRLPGCYNPACANLDGASEADLPVRMCSGCRVARYCSAACSKQHWPRHKVACRLAAGSSSSSAKRAPL